MVDSEDPKDDYDDEDFNEVVSSLRKSIDNAFK
jgi:hypothetical protein